MVSDLAKRMGVSVATLYRHVGPRGDRNDTWASQAFARRGLGRSAAAPRSLLRARDPGRTEVIRRVAEAYGVSVWTIYRALRELTRPKSVRRYRLVDTERSPRKAVVRMSGFPRVSPKPA